LNPEEFTNRSILLQLARLIPFVENNYNLIELGPKGTGKSHVYSELSPHGILISGGEVSKAKLFVNNSNGEIGLVGYWDVVALDEFAGKTKKSDQGLVDIMKNYMARDSCDAGGSFHRDGGQHRPLGAAHAEAYRPVRCVAKGLLRYGIPGQGACLSAGVGDQ
jgi:uncharacterized protein (TIGR02688 family)